MIITSWILFVLSTVWFCMGIRIVPEDQRFVLFRLGRLQSVLQPGLRWIIPFVDRVIRVSLDHAVPGWRTLPEEHLHEKLRHLVISGQLDPTSIRS